MFYRDSGAINPPESLAAISSHRVTLLRQRQGQAAAECFAQTGESQSVRPVARRDGGDYDCCCCFKSAVKRREEAATLKLTLSNAIQCDVQHLEAGDHHHHHTLRL